MKKISLFYLSCKICPFQHNKSNRKSIIKCIFMSMWNSCQLVLLFLSFDIEGHFSRNLSFQIKKVCVCSIRHQTVYVYCQFSIFLDRLFNNAVVIKQTYWRLVGYVMISDLFIVKESKSRLNCQFALTLILYWAYSYLVWSMKYHAKQQVY